MSPSKINLVLRVLALVTAAGTIAAVVAGLTLPVRLPASGQATTIRSRGTEPRTAALPPLDAFAGVWAHRFRKPLEETLSPPEAPTVVAPMPDAAPLRPPVTLVGTIGTSLAMFKRADGSTVVKAVGEQAVGAEVIAVRPAAVDVRFAGRIVTLEKPADTAAPLIIVGSTGDASHDGDPQAH